ncbi:MAG: hypothetical protein KA340_08755 [Saprospiraceae bacterium]|nr:hypothetical protein [Saprospiraceae bacterium]
MDWITTPNSFHDFFTTNTSMIGGVEPLAKVEAKAIQARYGNDKGR